jgi:hypothetical protein
MDVDAGERRPHRRRRGSHAAARRHARPTPAGSVAGRDPAMKKPPELYVIREAEIPATSNVRHISGIRSHGPADPHSVGRPWPSQHAWRNLVRSLIKKPTP